MSSRMPSPWCRTGTGLLLGIMLVLSVMGASYAADNADHERARQAAEAGDVLPLRTILDRVEREYPGQVMEVELDREKGEWVYEIKLLRKGGILMKLKIQARDGIILGFKEKPDMRHRKGEHR
jgi:uncharacterized membrane protein YkoI